MTAFHKYEVWDYCIQQTMLTIWSGRLIDKSNIHVYNKINGLVEDCRNSIANALGLLQFCTKPEKFSGTFSISRYSAECATGIMSPLELMPLNDFDFNPTMDNLFTSTIKCEMELLIHFQTSMVEPLKFGNG